MPVTRTSILICFMSLSGLAAAQSAQNILDTARAKQLERWQGVDSFAVTQNIAGTETTTYFQRIEIADDAGKQHTFFVPKSVAASVEDSWVAAGGMTGGTSALLQSAAAGQQQESVQAPSASTDAVTQMANFIAMAELAGTETVNGRNAFVVRATDINRSEKMEGGEFTLQSVSLWIDSESYVALRNRIEGFISDEGGQSRPMLIEQVSSDYRNVPGSNMYESYRQQLTVSGVLDEAQQAELQEAQQQLAELEQQMASMPENQRAMMEQMLGPKLEMMRSMASGGGFQTEVVVTKIEVNPDPVAQSKPGTAVPTTTMAPAAGGSEQPDGLLQMIQEKLARLGYKPGNTDGLASTETAIAISQFQAERGMPVTGEASPQLAGILAAETGRQGGGAQPPAPAQSDEQALQAARQACLQEKMAAAQQKQKKKRGFGRLMSAVSRTAMNSGDYDLARKTSDIYSASATADDLAAAAKDLGLTEDDIEACQNPV